MRLDVEYFSVVYHDVFSAWYTQFITKQPNFVLSNQAPVLGSRRSSWCALIVHVFVCVCVHICVCVNV